MKFIDIIKYLGWLSGLFGGLLILGGIIGFLVGGEFLGVRNFYNWFYIADGFIMFGIFCLLAFVACIKKKEE